MITITNEFGQKQVLTDEEFARICIVARRAADGKSTRLCSACRAEMQASTDMALSIINDAETVARHQRRH